MDTQIIVDRLRAQLTGWVQIAGAADLEAATTGLVRPPAAFVLPLEEQGSANRLMNRQVQRVTCRFGVVIVIANLVDPSGAAANRDLVARRLAVRSALLGWAPVVDEGLPVEFSSGRILRFEDQRLWWTDEFIVDTYYRSA